MDPVAVTLVVALWSVTTTALWLAIGWQAMRAHERIAESLAALNRILAERTKE
jgi:hypothetical protein